MSCWTLVRGRLISCLLALVVASAACGRDSHPTADVASDLDAVSGELILTRQRDLLDRGLINVRFINDSTVQMTMTGRHLIVDRFDTEPAEQRSIGIPTGRPVNLQVPFGVVADCEQPGQVTAHLEFTFFSSEDDQPRNGRAELTGTELLDTIRGEQCAQFAFDDAVDVSFDEMSVDGEQMTVELVLTPKSASGPELELRTVFGTILVGVEAAAVPVVVGSEAQAIPLHFFVIRCDPHAMAEVTKRFGLELDLAVNGVDPRAVDVDLAPIEAELNSIVGSCRTRTSTSEALND